jgi:hypothetical protein
MSSTQNSISSLVAQFLRLQKNALEIINGLNEVATSTNETVSIQILDEFGVPTNANIPSYGFMRGEIQRIDNNIRTLAGLGTNSSTVRNADGTYSQIFKAEPLKDPAPLTNLPVPSTFQTRDNWFFESFLSPLLYINIDVTGKISDSADRIKTKRIIANTVTQIQKDFFDQNLKGRNDLNYNDFIRTLTGAGITYYTDEDIIDLPLRTLRYSGNFGVLSFYDDVVSTTDANGQIVQQTRRNYKLTTLNYTDTTTNVTNGKSLNVGDRLQTADGSLYEVTSVNITETSIQAKRINGYQPITIGTDVLSISNPEFGPRFIQVNVGFDEREAIFFKTVDDYFNIVSSTWSNGVSFWSNELLTRDSSGNVISLSQFYLTQVADIGKIFMDMAKEKTIPAIQGLTPNVPVVAETNFKVVQINTQVTDNNNAKTLAEKSAQKAQLESEIASLDTSINQVKTQINQGLSTIVSGAIQGSSVASRLGSKISAILNQGSQSTPPPGVNIPALQSQLQTLIDQKTQKSQLFSTLVNDIQTLSKTTPAVTATPKYRARGFWAIPAPVNDPNTGPQNVIQFKIRYRYLSDGGSFQPTEQIEYVDNDGQKKTGSFSNWTEYKTEIRQKVYDSTKGIYVWADQLAGDANVVNINQIDIPINQGEQLEFQIASVSEAGWPANPLTSEYSESIILSFPTDLPTEGLSSVSLQNNQDAAVVKIQQQLDSQGLPSHLSQQFTAGSVTYYHNTNGIASGFFDAAGNNISLFDKIVELQNQISDLQSRILQARGILEVFFVDGTNQTKLSKGQSISLIAPFYNEVYLRPTTTDAGSIVTQTYIIKLVNNQASPVELVSLVPGGYETQAPVSGYTNLPGYDTNLRYGAIPISITSYTIPDVSNNTSFRQAPPFASASSYGQFAYPRFKSVGQDQDLYLTNTFTFNNSYSYDGTLGISVFGTTGGVLPINGDCLIPYDPSVTPPAAAGATSAFVWSGGFTSTSAVGGGNISEFCVHIDHPYLASVAPLAPTYSEIVKPFYDSATVGIAYPPFRHSVAFYADSTLPGYYQQTPYRNVTTIFPTTSTDPLYDSMYPDKLGFEANDQYLIGKYSCGSYLFLAPNLPSVLQVDGFTSQSTKTLLSGDSNAITIPLLFQFRATDRLGYIGGWRASGTLSNISYTKKIGIDIQVQNESTFSFDVSVTGKYKNDILVAPNFGGNAASSASITA